ncbi:hypothetical protein ABBQ38_000150 [Trebouxia sp. C0009 RCD-2024]
MSQTLLSRSCIFTRHLHKHLTTRTRLPAAGSLIRTQAMASQSSKYYLLQYQYTSDILEKRGPHRDAHIGAARQQADAGKMLIAGASGDPVDSALFIWQDVSKQDIEEFVKTDPYVKAGLVTDWKIQPYMAVVGTAMSKT